MIVNSQAPIPNIAHPSQHDQDTHLGVKNGDDKAGRAGFAIRATQGLAVALLKSVGIDSALLDAQLLMAHVLQIPRIDVQLQGQLILTHEELSDFWALIARRLCGEPVAYLLSVKEFYGLSFFVNKDCLIPRPDTEVVVEQCLALIEPSAQPVIFDVCTGSGAIGIAILAHRAGANVIATDISHKALAVAIKNAESLGVMDRFVVRQGDLFKAFGPNERADIIVSNPPYIASHNISSLARDVREYEPRNALVAYDARGVEFYERILRDAPKFLTEQGYLVLEIGFDQEQDIKKLIGPLWRQAQFFTDLAGHKRGVVLQKL